VTLVLGVTALMFGGTALATAPTGQTLELLARGSAGRLHVKHNGIRLTSRTAADVAVATITFAPNGSSGWHHHPGLVVIVVKSGEITFYDRKCRTVVHKAGDVFVESHEAAELAKNTAPGPTVVEATFIVPSSAAGAPPSPLRIEDPQPKRCNVT